MMPEYGHALLCLALGVALLLSVYPLWGVARGDARMMASAGVFAWLLFICVAGAFSCWCTPLWLTTSPWPMSPATRTRSCRCGTGWPPPGGARGLAAAVGAADERLDPGGGGVQPAGAGGYRRPGAGGDGDGLRRFSGVHPVHLRPVRPHAAGLSGGGRDLNPLLQDPGLIFHPPLLYMGYVGFSVAFAFAIAALLSGRLDSAFTRFARPWTLAAWVFLTLGIVLGSAWAYYELGWGGWWFWDPVENASFMPWLAGTALLHSLAVTEQRAGFKAWTLLLSICAFSLCLLGTFLVRSGVLVSVHAFASDPARGMFILAFMVLVTGGSLLLFAVRGTGCVRG